MHIKSGLAASLFQECLVWRRVSAKLCARVQYACMWVHSVWNVRAVAACPNDDLSEREGCGKGGLEVVGCGVCVCGLQGTKGPGCVCVSIVFGPNRVCTAGI